MVHHSKVNGSAKDLIIDLEKWLVGQAVKTPASHAGNGGSIPPRVTIYLIKTLSVILKVSIKPFQRFAVSKGRAFCGF